VQLILQEKIMNKRDWAMFAFASSPAWGTAMIGLITLSCQLHEVDKMRTDIESCITHSAGPQRPAPYQISEDCRVAVAGPNAAAFRPQYINYAHP